MHICRHDYENAFKEWKKASRREKLLTILFFIAFIFSPLEVLIRFKLEINSKWPWFGFALFFLFSLLLLFSWLWKKKLTKRKSKKGKRKKHSEPK